MLTYSRARKEASEKATTAESSAMGDPTTADNKALKISLCRR